MSDRERSGRRDLLYSRWHRSGSLAKAGYMPMRDAVKLECIDIDWCETCPYCHQPLALIETKNSAKPPTSFTATITAKLAAAARIQAFCVTYICVCTVDGDQHETLLGCTIESFQRQQIEPYSSRVESFSPAEYAGWLLSLRKLCKCLSASQGDRTA